MNREFLEKVEEILLIVILAVGTLLIMIHWR